MNAILAIPCRLKPTTRFLECCVGLSGAATGGMKRLRQIRNLRRATNLQTVVDRPGIAAGFGDQCWDT
ncbi:hypothetical protein LTS72_18335 [Mycobacterium ostraviense]|uniref:Uncharacterized protein n=1 Tax=Mycobacterium ostraviense TaxID=2738409 RepID=A0A164F016_9MYCO|nr:hypothetical protein [Mycobacterium ostraviense]KZS68162.1 hypothetical protein A4G28_19990 [Mycobacterium ostraviense]UGT90296.1 hypothetical protein LTS72_18335 [Mycobacterium ostraviense]